MYLTRLQASRALIVCSGGILASGCGGRILAVSTPDGAPPSSSITDAREAGVSDADASGPDGPGDDTTQADAAPANSADAQSRSPGSSFSAACRAFASSVGRTSCEACVSQANGQCDDQWSQLREQCELAYDCGTQCICTAPCSSADVCSCIAGCLPLQDNPCTRLWTALMSCVGSVCAGHC